MSHDDLVERLRSFPVGGLGATWLMKSAADRIVAQDAEIRRLRAERDQLIDQVHTVGKQALAARAVTDAACTYMQTLVDGDSNITISNAHDDLLAAVAALDTLPEANDG